MKLLILNKESIIIFISIIFFVFIIFLYSSNNVSILDVSNNEIVISDFHTNINNITKNADEKFAYLTFDDGPSKYATERILNILKDENIKASFFVVGKYVKEYPEVTKRAFEEGHYIANHGYNHNNKKLYSSSENFIKEIKDTDLEIGKAIGIPNYCSHLFRFPNGYMSPNNKYEKKKAVQLLKDLDYSYIDWNCLNNDSIKKYSPQQLLINLKKTAKNKKNNLIILMHDTTDRSDSSKALKISIDFLRSEGYSFDNFYFNNKKLH